MDKTEDLRLGHSISDNSERLLRRDKGEPGYIGVFATKTKYRNIKGLLLIKENQTSQVKEFRILAWVMVCVDQLKELPMDLGH